MEEMAFILFPRQLHLIARYIQKSSGQSLSSVLNALEILRKRARNLEAGLWGELGLVFLIVFPGSCSSKFNFCFPVGSPSPQEVTVGTCSLSCCRGSHPSDGWVE